MSSIWGSFLGGSSLKDIDSANECREINGAADGFLGWLVDRNDQWLLVQLDDIYEVGPLPFILDGNKVVVYYFSMERDRSVSGAQKVKPTLMEGRPAPDNIPIKEDGIKISRRILTIYPPAIFDQRFQRAWLSRCYTKDTKVLNCFSHCGAFCIVAATTGAETISLDLTRSGLTELVHIWRQIISTMIVGMISLWRLFWLVASCRKNGR